MVRAFGLVADEVERVLTPLMQEHNWRKASGLVRFYGDPNVVKAVANEPRFGVDRQILRDLLQHALSRSGKYVPFQECSVPGCKLPRCNLPGSTYCEGHHAVRFQEPPTLEDFLRNDVYRAVFREYCRSARPEMQDVLGFMERAKDVSQLRAKHVLAERARVVFDQYVREGAERQLFFLADVDPREGSGRGGAALGSRSRLDSANTAGGESTADMAREASGFSLRSAGGIEDAALVPGAGGDSSRGGAQPGVCAPALPSSRDTASGEDGEAPAGPIARARGDSATTAAEATPPAGPVVDAGAGAHSGIVPLSVPGPMAPSNGSTSGTLHAGLQRSSGGMDLLAAPSSETKEDPTGGGTESKQFPYGADAAPSPSVNVGPSAIGAGAAPSNGHTPTGGAGQAAPPSGPPPRIRGASGGAGAGAGALAAAASAASPGRGPSLARRADSTASTRSKQGGGGGDFARFCAKRDAEEYEATRVRLAGILRYLYRVLSDDFDEEEYEYEQVGAAGADAVPAAGGDSDGPASSGAGESAPGSGASCASSSSLRPPPYTRRKGAVRSTVFKGLVRECRWHLHRVFEGEFKFSQQYAEWADVNLGLEVPEVTAGRAAILKAAGVSIGEAMGVRRVSSGEIVGSGPASGSGAGAGAGATGSAPGSYAASIVSSQAGVGVGRAGTGMSPVSTPDSEAYQAGLEALAASPEDEQRRAGDGASSAAAGGAASGGLNI